MNASRWFAGLAAIVLMGVGACLQAQEVLPPNPEPAVIEESFEVATRGPLHEAFAKPYSSEPVAGITIDVAPPEPVEELPPAVAPEGENVEWVPGYWGWEPDAQAFIWISGIWRNAPPGQQWVPGYWTEVDGQYQWVSGFWTSDQTDALVYLPYPPENPEQGPATTAPDGDYFWVPGNWLWVGNEYQWQPGYWSRAYEEWIWNPAQYTWTPYGCVYTAGYWDFRPVERGIVFAPVFFRPAVARTTVVRYTPSVVVHVPRTFVHWFVSPRYHHYYYGNYYGRTYANVNLTPWYAYQTQFRSHDPLLNYYRWYYARQNVDFVDRLQRWNRYYTVYENRRPPVTFAQQREVFRSIDEDAAAGHFRLAQNFDEIVQDRQGERRFRRLEQARRQELAEASVALREVQQLRNRVERMAARQPGDQTGVRDGGIRRLELPDEARTALRLSPDQDGRQDRIADGRRPDGRRGDRPRGPDFAQDRGDQRPEGDRRRPDGERVRAARPITPDTPDDEDARRGPPARPDQQAQQPPARPDQEVQREPGQGEPARPGVEPGAVSRQRPEQPDRRPERQLDGQQRPDRGTRPDQQPERGEDAARQAPGPRRGQARGFDGRRLPVPTQLRPEGPDAAAPGEDEATARRIPPFSARRGPDRGPQGQRQVAPGRPLRDFGPLDQQPPEIERDEPRARGPARADRARGAARQAQGGPPPGRGPAVDRPDRDDDRRGPPQRTGRDRPEPERGEDDRPRPKPQAEEPDDEQQTEGEQADE